MFRSLLHAMGRGIRWLLFSITVLLLIEELVRVPVWVIRTWGLPHALVDGAVLYKLGEAAVLLPFLVFVHFHRRWGAERAATFARRARWTMWAGGLISAAATVDLVGRVPWAFWTVVLALLGVLLPLFMRWAARRRALRTGDALATGLIGMLLAVYLLSVILIGGWIVPLPTSRPWPAKTEAGRWQQDLDYLAANLELLHENAYHATSRERFAAEAARFRAAIPELSEAEIRVGLTRIAALVGDGHTAVTGWNSRRAPRYPVRFYVLDDGLFVTAAPRSHSGLLGARLLRLNDTPADSAFAWAASMVAHETAGHVQLMAARYLSNAIVLDALGIADPDEPLQVTVVAATGDTLSARLAAGREPLLQAPDPLPAFRTDSEKQYWSRFDDADRTAYLKYNAFIDPVGFRSFSANFWNEVEERDLEYVIVDLRENGGGASATFHPFFQQILAHARINRPGHLYVLVDRRTFSSAVLCAVDLRRETAARVAGEEMGGAANSYGELRRFRLPNSRIEVTFSLSYFERWPDDRPWRIDIPVEVSSEQYFAGEDPVLDEVMARIRADLAPNDR